MAGRGYHVCLKANDKELPADVYDIVIVGAGIAGMSAALSLPKEYKIGLISKAPVSESSTYKAQGGMAVAVGSDDSPADHLADTLRVGQGICNRKAAEILVNEGPAALDFLQSLGTKFDQNEDGLQLTKEAGHSHHRIVHYYDYTGRRIAETLEEEVRKRENIHCSQGVLIDLVTDDQKCCGCIVNVSDQLKVLYAQDVVMATGGYSGLFARSTNSVSSSGDGIAAAYRAGAVIADMEFVQFHPTTFTTLEGKVFLLTEALRGEGAVLLNHKGERFMFSYHPNGELAPRDEVSRAIVHEMQQASQQTVFLDARKLGKEYLSDRFRQVYSELAKNNLFMEKDLIPTAPAAHYTIGGIQTNLCGQSSLDHLYACGEAAATGVHGANRLASNSLLEGVVFGRRVAKAISRQPHQVVNCQVKTAFVWQPNCNCREEQQIEAALEHAAGVMRKGLEMEVLLANLQQCLDEPGNSYHEFNACQLTILLLEAALLRCESRGTHFREEYPQKDRRFEGHITHQWGKKAVFHE